MRSPFSLAILLLFGLPGLGYAQAEQQLWIESGSEKAVVARHSKSPDRRHALAWVVEADPATIDWALLTRDPDSFYEKYEVRELWIVDLTQNRKLCSLGSSIGYVRPGSHRSLHVAWGPLEGGRRFAIAGTIGNGEPTLLFLSTLARRIAARRRSDKSSSIRLLL